MDVIWKVVLLIVLTECSRCDGRLCLTWSLYGGDLLLNCKSDNLELKILLYDPRNNEVAYCLMSSAPICHVHIKNASIKLVRSKNETILTLHSVMDNEINGDWVCRHGTNYEYASVNVSSQGIKDIKGLSITTTKKFPIIVSQATDIICTATATDSIIRLFWDCVEITDTESTVINCTTYTSRISYKASLADNDKICKCTAKINNFIATTTLQLSIHEAPVIHMVNRVNCRMSFPITIICNAEGYLPRYRFAPWIHTLKDKQLRQIHGISNTAGNISSLVFDSCQVGDSGTYTCSLKDTDENEMIWSNTSSLIITDTRVFSLTIVLWIVAVITVLIVTIAITTSIVFNRLKKNNWRQRSPGAVYFGAPQTDHTVNTYDVAGHDYEEINDFPEQQAVEISTRSEDTKNEEYIQMNIPVYLDLE